MAVQASPGELLVGAYHQLINECEVVSYNQRSLEQGNQMELDVLAIQSENEEQTVYACEVITHVKGMLYVGTPETKRWTEFGNDNYQYTLERIWNKFETDFDYVTSVFDSADEYHFQLWSPNVPVGYRTDGLQDLGPDLESTFQSRIETDCYVDLMYNEAYSDRIRELRRRARNDAKAYGNTAMRYLQILEHLR